MRPSSEQKRDAALRAAEDEFLATGYESVTMESIAKRSGVAKQTLYSHFGSKRALFLELVTASTSAARSAAFARPPSPEALATPRLLLRDQLIAQLTEVLKPEVLAMRRLVIGELSRAPELAEALHRNGPERAIEALAETIDHLTSLGALDAPDPRRAATHLNWLVMGEPINRAMLLGAKATLTPTQIEEHVAEALDVFFRAYATTAKEQNPSRVS